MRVLLLRHGIASTASRRRPAALTRRGLTRTRRAARGLFLLGARPDQVWSSPALCAVQTAQIAAEELGVGLRPIQLVDSLAADADPEGLCTLLTAASGEELLVVGHGPLLETVLASLVGTSQPGALRLGKCGAACLDVEEGSATVRWLMRPGQLRRVAALERGRR